MPRTRKVNFRASTSVDYSSSPTPAQFSIQKAHQRTSPPQDTKLKECRRDETLASLPLLDARLSSLRLLCLLLLVLLLVLLSVNSVEERREGFRIDLRRDADGVDASRMHNGVGTCIVDATFLS